MSQSSSPTIVPLPGRLDRQKGGSAHNKAPIWPITSAENGVTTALAAKCARTARADGVCCKELLKEERTLIDPDIVRDV